MSTIASTPTRLAILEALNKKYADARAIVAERVNALDDEVRAVHRRKVPGIRTAVAAAQDAKAEVVTFVQGNQDLFVKPRTVTIHGVQAGLKKGSGKVTWDDDDEVIVARIRELCPRPIASRLIVLKEVPSKEELRELDAATLAKLGVELEGTGDVVVVRAMDGEVDKLVKRILKEGAVEEAEES